MIDSPISISEDLTLLTYISFWRFILRDIYLCLLSFDFQKPIWSLAAASSKFNISMHKIIVVITL